MKKIFYPIFYLFILTLISNEVGYAQTNQYVWKKKANIIGVARYGPFCFSIDSLIYVGGGYEGSSNLNDLWQYSPAANKWTQKENAPISLRAAMTFVINGKGYLTGGIEGGAPFNTTLWMYDPVLNTWTAKASYPGTGLYGGVGFAIGTKGYIGIGNSAADIGPYLTDFYEYDAISNIWAVKASFPDTSRFGTYGISLNGKGYVGLGGNEVLAPFFFKGFYEYNPLTNTWTKKASFPGTGRDYVCAFTINNQVFAGGGNIGNGNVAKDFYKYDPLKDAWTRVADFGGGVRWIAVGGNIANKGYCGMGLGIGGSAFNNDFWEYSPDGEMNSSESNLTNFGSNNGIGIQTMAYPNPFSTNTTIEFTKTDVSAHLLVEVYTLTGNRVSTLFNKIAAAGITYTVDFNATNLASGVYIYRIVSGSDVINNKLIIIK